MDQGADWEVEIEARMINWARWSRERRGRGRVASAEGAYRSPQCWYPPQPRITPDPLDALTVDKALRELPKRHMRLLKHWYFDRFSWKAICRKLALRFAEFEGQRQRAKIMLRNLLLFR